MMGWHWGFNDGRNTEQCDNSNLSAAYLGQESDVPVVLQKLIRRGGTGGDMNAVWQCEKEIKQYQIQTVDLDSWKVKRSNSRKYKVQLRSLEITW